MNLSNQRWDDLILFGAAGFVGSTLVGFLVDETVATVSLIDHKPIPHTSIEAAATRGADVTALALGSLDELPYICHPASDHALGPIVVVLAGKTDVDQALVEPAQAFEANTSIAIGAGEWLRAHPRARMIYLSTDEVLGETHSPLDESAPRRPTQPYAASKASAELILECYAHAYSLDLVIVRSCNLIGRHQRARKLLPIAVTQLMSNREVPIYGSGDQVREWMAVEDLCRAISMFKNRDIPAGVYHCASGYRRTTLEVVDLIANAIHRPKKWQHVADRLVHDQMYAMNSELLSSWGWAPQEDPEKAISQAAADMAEAWAQGENLMTGTSSIDRSAM